MNTSKTQRKLDRKRENLIRALKEAGQEPHESLTRDHVDLLKFGYASCGKLMDTRGKELSYPALHGYYNAINRWLKKAKKPTKKKTRHDFNAFYRSYAWRKLRYKILLKYGASCMVCGRTKRDGIIIHVEHIKPVKFNWGLRLDAANLQVFCHECNHGKGNWDETDWREPRLATLMGEAVD